MIDREQGAILPHQPVLYQEIINSLKPCSGGRYVDGTLGAGGHAWGILQASSPDGLLLGLDVDPLAIKLAQEHLADYGTRAIIIQSSYVMLTEQIRQLGWSSVNGILLDLGVSSMQLDQTDRGFSFQTAAALDMRFDPRNQISAADLVNELPEKELADIIFQYGEERHARRIAKAITYARPIRDTLHLANVIRKTSTGRHTDNSRRRQRIHPATRTFQALRIAVNKELDALERVLPQAAAALSQGSRLAVMSFHSLEDRMVKVFIRRESRDCICPPRQPVCTCGHKATLKEINRKPIRPHEDEIKKNPRSRSARLRIAEKI